MTAYITMATIAILAVSEELKTDPSQDALKVEKEGWVDLLQESGPTLQGWTRVPIPPRATLNPESQWSLDSETGSLVCEGDLGHEWLRWDQEIADGIFRVEARFTPRDSGLRRYNSGVFVRNSADGKIWHQAQLGGGSGGFLFGDTPVDGTIARINFRGELTENQMKPAGEWNSIELQFEGPRIRLRVNGVITNDWDRCQFSEGYVGLEAEGYRIEFRKVMLKRIGSE